MENTENIDWQELHESVEICEKCKCCEMIWEDCWQCGGEGGTDGEELMMEDPMWYSEDDFRECDICEGKGGYYVCTCDENGKHKEPAKCEQAHVSSSVATCKSCGVPHDLTSNNCLECGEKL